MTGDDHGNGGTAGRFDQLPVAAARPAARSPTGSACAAPPTSTRAPRSPTPRPPPTRAQGFEIALHVTTNCDELDRPGRSSRRFYSSQLARFAAEYPSLPAPATNRTHCIAWSDWATQPKVELEHGIRLDTNYYYWPAGLDPGPPRACSPARGCRCASPTSTAR